MAPLTLGIYLAQCNDVVWDYLNNSFVFVNNVAAIFKIPVVILLAIGIFVFGSIVELTRKCLFKILKLDNIPAYIDSIISGHYLK